jgi:hypothetical protein
LHAEVRELAAGGPSRPITFTPDFLAREELNAGFDFTKYRPRAWLRALMAKHVQPQELVEAVSRRLLAGSVQPEEALLIAHDLGKTLSGARLVADTVTQEFLDEVNSTLRKPTG